MSSSRLRRSDNSRASDTIASRARRERQQRQQQQEQDQKRHHDQSYSRSNSSSRSDRQRAPSATRNRFHSISEQEENNGDEDEEEFGSMTASVYSQVVVSANDVIRESMISSRASEFYHDDHDDHSQSYDGRESLASMSSNSRYSRRSTLLPDDEDIPEETDFDDEDLESLYSEGVRSSASEDDYDGSGQSTMMSLHAEPKEVKILGARQRWAQQARLKAMRVGMKTRMFGLKSNNNTTEDRADSSTTTLSNQQSSSATSATPDPGTKATSKLDKMNKWFSGQHENTKVAFAKVLEYSKSAATNIDLNGDDEEPQEMMRLMDNNPKSLLSLEEVINNPRMIRFYAAWLSIEDQSKLFFLCSLDEFRGLWRQIKERSGQETVTYDIEEENAHVLRTFSHKIFSKYLDEHAEFHIGEEFLSREIRDQIQQNAEIGGEASLRAFDVIAMESKQILMSRFPDFRNSDLYIQLKQVKREVYSLEDILLNHRFANFFWIFLFQHNYHRELALWLEIEYDLKPVYREYSKLLELNGLDEKNNSTKVELTTTIKYLIAKYYPQEEKLANLHLKLSNAFVWLKQEQESIVTKLNVEHLELYPRFIAGKAYAEFASYRNQNPHQQPKEEKLDANQDLRRLSFLLRHYGLRAHQWPEDASSESRKEQSLEKLRTNAGQHVISHLVTFEPQVDAQSIRLAIHEHLIPKEKPSGQNNEKSEEESLPSSIEGFLLPWLENPDVTCRFANSCPAPVAFNSHVGDGPTELYIAVLIVYERGPVYTEAELKALPKVSGFKWVPHGLALFSKYPLLYTLRDRLARHYLENAETPWRLTSQAIDLLTQRYVPTVPFTASLLNLQQFPTLDHSLSLVFEVLTVAMVLKLYTALLLEHRVILISSHYSVLGQLAESMRVLMYPLIWPHVYIPILPGLMLQYTQCPTPFLFGIHKDFATEEVLEDLGGEVVCIDLDQSMMVRGQVSMDLPPKLHSSMLNGLNRLLKKQMIQSDDIFYDQRSQPNEMISSTSRDENFPVLAIRQLFHDCIYEAIGEFGFHRYVWKDELSQAKAIVFDEASYLAASPAALRDFRTAFIATQAFSEFMTSHNGFTDK